MIRVALEILGAFYFSVAGFVFCFAWCEERYGVPRAMTIAIGWPVLWLGILIEGRRR